MIAFISGHTNLTSNKFELHYRAAIDKAIQDGHDFVIGHAEGADFMALEYLLSHGVSSERITIFIFDRWKQGLAEKYPSVRDDNYKSYSARDAAMTENSDYDILWVRPESETKQLLGNNYKPGRVSGTEQNRLRRVKKMAS
jgi:hypothetical protein